MVPENVVSFQPAGTHLDQSAPDHIDLLLDDGLRGFRLEVRRFLRSAVPEDVRERVDRGLPSNKSEIVALQRALNEKGWGAPSWPEEHGGTGWTPMQQFLFNYELGANAAPPVPPVGTGMVGPIIYTFGSPEQKDFYLPRIRSGEDWWCQGFSELGAGSDLASLSTRAEDAGDHFLVNGENIWTDDAQCADRIFCLVRTSEEERKQDGITCLVFDMDLPGIEVRPILGIDGSHSLNSIHFKDVEVPRSGLVGDMGKGWSYARFLLQNEGIGLTCTGRSRRQLARLKTYADRAMMQGASGRPSPSFLTEVARVDAELTALEVCEIRMRSHGPDPAAASMLKVRGSEMQQHLTALLVDSVGHGGVAFGPVPDESDHAETAGVMQDYLHSRRLSMFGTTNEIHRDIIAGTVLG